MSASTELLQTQSNVQPAGYAESAFNRAKAEWSDRLGGTVQAARNWRLAAFAALSVAAMAVVGLMYQSSKSSVVPYYIRVAENGEPAVVGVVPEVFSPSLNEVRWQLATWLEWVRATPLDPVVVKKNYRSAMYFMRQAAANKLNEWAQSDPRLKNIGRETVEFSLIGIAPISGSKSYQARWKELFRNSEGGLREEQHWVATFDVDILPPTSVDQIQHNPIGLYIKDFQWTREQ
jgi:type IV secretory pathway TrbF-like protein